jgi:CHAT domain-containing protein
MRINNITIRGQKHSQPVAVTTGDTIRLDASYSIALATRGVVETHTIDLKDSHVIELVFEDDTVWLCNPDTLERVFPGAAAVASRSVNGSFEIPTILRSDNDERGVIGNVILKTLNLFTKKSKTGVKTLAEHLEKNQLDNYSGLYRLGSDFELHDFVGDETARPYLLFLHGTCSSTKGSFGELLTTPLWKYAQQEYGTNILAFQHETLTKSPLFNVLELIRQLPGNSSLHIISHSRGGLVGDILSRFCNSNDNSRGFNMDEVKYLTRLGRTNDVEMLSLIKKELQNKKISVSKFIRVACPASGTILASKRLDGFLNISFNLLGYATGLGASPVYSAFRNLIAAAIDTKNDTSILPGLEAMDPESPFIKVLNSPGTSIVIDDPLTVISGNCEVKVNLKALLILAGKIFYQQQNDLVVHTSSMYLGAKRSMPVQYFFDDNTNVDHFHYFKNKRTNDAILSALKTDRNVLAPGFSFLEDALGNNQRNILFNLDGGQEFTNLVSGEKPILVLLPGIMGSNLTKNGKLLWINYLRFLDGSLTDLDIKSNGINAVSIIKTSYKKLVDFLLQDYDVVTFPFDWRLQLTKSASLFNDKIKELLKYKQPIKIIGHSMGGVLVRDFIVSHPDTWKTLNASDNFKLIFLGAPLGGSFRIPAVLFGQDAIINKLSKIDIFHSKKDLLQVFSKMPGILSLLPLNTDAKNDFSLMNTWKQMTDEEDWPLPLTKDLKDFEKHRDLVLSELENIDYTNIIYIAGKDKATPYAYTITPTNEGQELAFLSTTEGDQSVTWASGIPKKMIEKDVVYYVDVTHGALANEPFMFKGIEEILVSGSTKLLSKNRPVDRSIEKTFRAPEQETIDITPAGIERTILGMDPLKKPTAGFAAGLKTSVSCGDLHYASHLLLASHFLGDGIVNAESVIDFHLDGTLSERNKLGLYPGEIGTSELFTSAKSDFNGALVIGLGKAGTLTAHLLTRTVEQSITRYLLNINSKKAGEKIPGDPVTSKSISSLIIGSGYGSLSIESSLQAIIQGIKNANSKIQEIRQEGAILIEELEFVEQYEDTALTCFYALHNIVADQSTGMNITLEKNIRFLLGSKRKLQGEISKDWWKRISVTRANEQDIEDLQKLQFSLSTGGAREEQRDLLLNHKIVSELIERLSTGNLWTSKQAKIVFELIIPNDFKEQLKTQSNLSWILEKGTAEYPWELLQDTDSGALPFCVSAGMIRQLITNNFRQRVNAATKENALVIGDPDLNGFKLAQQLPGALKEAQAMIEMFTDQGYTTTSSLQQPATTIIGKLLQDEYKIMHLAGHGIFNKQSPARSGMLIGNDIYLSVSEIDQMVKVPELVFVNCCFLGKIDAAAEEIFQGRYKLAANIGTQLIEIGVKAVVVAGWAVDDTAALEFTKEFYSEMFNGSCFGDAVKKARKHVYDRFPGTNTWGAYQCYGDPFYTLTGGTNAKKTPKKDYIIPDQASTELYNLHKKLDASKSSTEKYLEELNSISERVTRAGFTDAVIVETMGLIYTDLCEYDSAIAQFERLLSMEKATFSIATLEKYCNVRVKKYAIDFLNDDSYKKNKTKRQALLKQVNKVILDLETLLKISATAERHGLLGSAYKRQALICSTKPTKLAALGKAAWHYYHADNKDTSMYKVYSRINWLEIEVLFILAGLHKWGQTVKLGRTSYVLPARESIIEHLDANAAKQGKGSGNMDYWQMIEKASIKLCKGMLNTVGVTNEVTGKDVLDAYREVWAKAGSKGKKIAEIEQLELLIDGLSLTPVKASDSLRKTLEQLKNDLKKMI